MNFNNDSIMISPNWLKNHLEKPNLYVADVEVADRLNIVAIEANSAVDAFEVYHRLDGFKIKINDKTVDYKLSPRDFLYVGPSGTKFCIAYMVATQVV